jgi:glucosamine--fructose-6-phosphate aminotransferase (isomerizing)
MPSLVNKVDEVYVLDEGELVLLDKGEFVIKSEGERIYKQASKFDTETADVTKGKYEHWMLKEIIEQPEVVTNALLGRLSLDT